MSLPVANLAVLEARLQATSGFRFFIDGDMQLGGATEAGWLLLRPAAPTSTRWSRGVRRALEVEKNSISIVSPYSIRAKYDASIGNFGVPDYGGSLVGTVVYPQKGAFGCSAFEGDKPFKSKTPRPNILLVDRGALRGFVAPINFRADMTTLMPSQAWQNIKNHALSLRIA
nr:vacuolar-sorting receptor 6-like [Ipomoea batatas]